MSKTLSDDAKRLIDAPNIAHLTTLMEDGFPKAEPVWIGRDGDRIIVCTDHKSIKGQNIDRDPRVALSITGPVRSMTRGWAAVVSAAVAIEPLGSTDWTLNW